MKCPYNRFEILTARLTLNQKLEKNYPGEKGDEELAEMFESLVANEFADLGNMTPAEEKLKIAEAQGITVQQLVDSPNYQAFKEEWMESNTLRVMKTIQETLNTTDVEAWAFMIMASES